MLANAQRRVHRLVTKKYSLIPITEFTFIVHCVMLIDYTCALYYLIWTIVDLLPTEDYIESVAAYHRLQSCPLCHYLHNTVRRKPGWVVSGPSSGSGCSTPLGRSPGLTYLKNGIQHFTNIRQPTYMYILHVWTAYKLYSETCLERPLPWENTCLERHYFPGRKSYI